MNVYKLIKHDQSSCFRARHHGKRYYINSVHNHSSVTRRKNYVWKRGRQSALRRQQKHGS